MIIIELNVIDLFCGAGGFSSGFKEEGFNILLGVDNEQHKLNVYKKNIEPDKILSYDITKLTINTIMKEINNKKIDIVIGSPVCKDFSKCNPYREEDNFLSGSRKGLAYHFYRIVSIIMPKWFVMENIAEYFQTLDGEYIGRLFELHGYNTKLYNLNAADFGVPQTRNRCFLIGNLKGSMLEFKPKADKRITIKEAIDDLKFSKFEEYKELIKLKEENLTEYQKLMHTKNHFVKNHTLTNHNIDTKNKLSKLNEGQRNNNQKNYYRQKYNDIAQTVTTRFDSPSGQGISIHPILDRSLTPREAARLQSFKDEFEFFGTKKQIREQIGEAVPPLLSQAIARKIKEELLKENKKDV